MKNWVQAISEQYQIDTQYWVEQNLVSNVVLTFHVLNGSIKNSLFFEKQRFQVYTLEIKKLSENVRGQT